LRSAGGRFGFDPSQGNQPIVPPGTEPDLQALNNPYVAMAKRNFAKSTHTDAEGFSTAAGNKNLPRSASPSQYSFTTGLLSHPSSRSTSIQPSAAASRTRVVSTFSEELLDPSLLPTGQPGESKLTEPEDVDTSSSDESHASDEDVDGDEEEFGWAEVGERRDAHPGE
jgi:hypothetical protein